MQLEECQLKGHNNDNAKFSPSQTSPFPAIFFESSSFTKILNFSMLSEFYVYVPMLQSTVHDHCNKIH